MDGVTSDALETQKSPTESPGTHGCFIIIIKFLSTFINAVVGFVHDNIPYPALLRECIAEYFGTALFLLGATGVDAVAAFTGSPLSALEAGFLWGASVATAIYCVAHISGAHLNPAISLTLAFFRSQDFPPTKLLAYWLSQLLGALTAAGIVYGMNAPLIAKFELEHGIVRGQPGSQLSAMHLCCYFPNPAVFGTGPSSESMVTLGMAFAYEMFGTFLLVLVLFAMSDLNNLSRDLGPLTIGLYFFVFGPLLAPFTQAAWNPARDLGPRLVALMAGWGDIAFPGPRNGFWIYLLAPLIGGPLGAGFYDFFLRQRKPLKAGAGNQTAPWQPQKSQMTKQNILTNILQQVHRVANSHSQKEPRLSHERSTVQVHVA
mmetsp:Transcript_45951/g.74960  ORF Transcript_45951/g.74960 Transcript_45951/m.74960 type:complete len:374 (-) Transcript_45951:131-1252(-)|eukprot:CAMPEP_0184658692 /NCGR_PEP_ID=MMETSP0308-20130426/26518_1 /TAXON_ID=38269 /ORGANISM="Gloeochaete witrockiana, Strain SAG 46.84" /LENGTH=373 /DNA_ID=CAMNT_0027097873 /DNA_START=156 /DNA_END=1277 /DNA_ORIENTATION=-